MLNCRPPTPFICRSCHRRLILRSKRQLNTQSEPPNLTFPKSVDHPPKWLPEGRARTRFAPSPTGNLHLGSIRTALFNYLIAKRTGGQFILRIEDTDDKRTVADATERICRDLRWAGLQWDEGPKVGGPFDPYIQSKAVSNYRQATDALLESGHAYRCFCGAATLKAKAESRLQFGGATEYDRTCYHIPKDQSDDWAAQGRAYVVRLKDTGVMTEERDLTYGYRFDHKKPNLPEGTYRDPILLKSNGLPTYHLASVVDDHRMRITHVIRGVEWLMSTHIHIALYEAFGWKPPTFAHVGLLLDENGNKLSKRDKRFDLRTMQNEGVLPEALCNYLALMGWKHVSLSGTTDDFLPMAKLEEIFDLRFTKANPIVSLNKLWYLQRRHAAARVEAGGAKFEQLVRLVMDTAEWQFGPYEHLLAGISDTDQLKRRCEWLVKANAQNYTTVTDFVKGQAYLFSSRPYISEDGLPAKPVAQRRRQYLRKVMEEYRITVEDVRAKVLEVLFLSDGFGGTAKELEARVGRVIDCIACIFAEANGVQLVEPGNEKKIASLLVNSLLRSWIAWDLSGPSLVEAMYELGPKIVRKRIEKVDVLHVDGDVERQDAVPAEAATKSEAVN